jgi:hypothetical protein
MAADTRPPAYGEALVLSHVAQPGIVRPAPGTALSNAVLLSVGLVYNCNHYE